MNDDRRSNVIVAMLVGVIFVAIVTVVMVFVFIRIGHALAPAPTTVHSSQIER